MTQKSILLTGGARSGKSHYAQEMAVKSGKKTLFVATAEAGDDEMRQRIAAHKASRPPAWETLEASVDVGEAIIKSKTQAEIIIVDCITLLVTNVFCKHADYTTGIVHAAAAEKEVTYEIEGLLRCMNRLEKTYILVTNEVGMGLVPANPIDRLYRDLLGKANRMLAEKADEVYLMVAGMPLKVKP